MINSRGIYRVALVDKQGCVRVQQTARGPVRRANRKKPEDVLVSTTGPVRTLFKQAKRLF